MVCVVQIVQVVMDQFWKSVMHLNSQGISATHIGVGTGALRMASDDMSTLTASLCNQVPYPFDTIIPGMVQANMLEICVDTETRSMRLRLLRDWSRALPDLSGLQAPGAMQQTLSNADDNLVESGNTVVASALLHMSYHAAPILKLLKSGFRLAVYCGTLSVLGS